jgi:hypothetical protein
MCKPGWLPAYWAGPEYDKHWPVYAVPWDEVVESTKDGVRKYHNDLSRADIQHLEMSYRKNGRRIQHPKDHLVAHWIIIDAEREVVGASNGVESNVILVKRNKTGPVHGHPINEQELREYEKYGYYEDDEQ